jgi:hypothetical protein
MFVHVLVLDTQRNFLSVGAVSHLLARARTLAAYSLEDVGVAGRRGSAGWLRKRGRSGGGSLLRS